MADAFPMIAACSVHQWRGLSEEERASIDHMWKSHGDLIMNNPTRVEEYMQAIWIAVNPNSFIPLFLMSVKSERFDAPHGSSTLSPTTHSLLRKHLEE